jgi:hypothetical protein
MIVNKECEVHFHSNKKQPTHVLGFRVDNTGQFFTGEHIMAALPSGMRGTPFVNWKDINGNIAQIDPNNPVTWTSDDPAVAEVVDVDGVTKVRGLLAGATLLHATADADLGDGFVAVSAVLPVEVPAGIATGGETGFVDLEPDPDAGT